MMKQDDMKQAESAETTTTRFVTVDGARFAYRRFGKPIGTPLLFLQHFRGSMDNWDPALLNDFAKDRISGSQEGLVNGWMSCIESLAKLSIGSPIFIGGMEIPGVCSSSDRYDFVSLWGNGSVRVYKTQRVNDIYRSHEEYARNNNNWFNRT